MFHKAHIIYVDYRCRRLTSETTVGILEINTNVNRSVKSNTLTRYVFWSDIQTHLCETQRNVFLVHYILSLRNSRWQRCSFQFIAEFQFVFLFLCSDFFYKTSLPINRQNKIINKSSCVKYYNLSIVLMLCW